ncbi:PKD domain-containing protein [Phytohabitans flavus]
MDGATSGVTISGLRMSLNLPSAGEVGVAIQVDGAGNRVLRNTFDGFMGGAIAVESGATDTVVVNNRINAGGGHGVHNRGAAHTAITNNTILQRCRDGIRVDGASVRVSVQNNVLDSNGSSSDTSCGSGNRGGAEIAVQDAAVRDTVVDYNNTYHPFVPDQAYAWGGTPMGLAAFRTTSGQGQHDRDAWSSKDVIDSANSAAPGYPSTDFAGNARIDDLGVPNTGAGLVPFADRGITETLRGPLVQATVTLDAVASTVKIDASKSVPGTVAIASYTFDFGDGTRITQTSPIASHRYTQWGDFTVDTRATGADGRYSRTSQQVSVLRPTGTFGLLSIYNLRYVYVRPGNTDLIPEDSGLTAAGQFDVVDAGSGRVALFSRATGKYVSDYTAGSGRLEMYRIFAGDAERFTLVRNADGSISLQSGASGRYISILTHAAPYLVANRTAIGPWEKFYQVKVTDAARSLKANVNGKYVAAESAGAKPLIANRAAVGPWERFDIIDLGNEQVALFSRANNHFVVAESAGAKPLIANRAAVGPWERFRLVRNSDGSVSFRSAINRRYVVAESAGSKSLIANRVAIGPWEKFTLG